jgi:hypothetical protein
MTTTTEIEAIVRRVLQGMLASGAAQSAVLASPTLSIAVSKKPANTVAISDVLITLSSIPKNLDGITELRIAKKSVVTPSVRDFLKSKNIRVLRGDLNALSEPEALADFVSSSSASSFEKSASTSGSASAGTIPHPIQPILIAGQSAWYGRYGVANNQRRSS